jgi:ABC-type uncharacterized transport system permease subunit
VQVIAAFVIAVAILVTRHLLAVVAGLLLMAGTIVGLHPGPQRGPVRLRARVSSGLANTVLIIEIVAVIMLAVTGLVLRR